MNTVLFYNAILLRGFFNLIVPTVNDQIFVIMFK